jgi:hypothetical protein
VWRLLRLSESFAVPSLAVAAPAELMNKSITVSYTVSIPGRAQDGSPTRGARNTTRVFYISSAGRVFSRVTRQDGPLTQTKEAAPGDAANTLRFEGSRLVGVMPFVSGAAQMTVSFGQGGESCNASIVVGRDSGRTLSWKGVNGKTYEAVGPATVSNVSCSISAGNAFAQ